MKVYDAASIRNVAVVGHGGSGKTQLVSALLFDAGMVNRLGKVDEGNTVTDYDEEEISRKHTLSASLAYAEWNKTKINLIDTPGFGNFFSDARAAMQVADGALIVVDAVAGVEVQTEKAWAACEEQQLPRLIVVNRLDRERASLERTLDSLRLTLNRTIMPIQLPIGEERDFSGVVDLVSMKAFTYAGDGSGKVTEGAVPANLADAANSRARSADRNGGGSRRSADGEVLRGRHADAGRTGQGPGGGDARGEDLSAGLHVGPGEHRRAGADGRDPRLPALARRSPVHGAGQRRDASRSRPTRRRRTRRSSGRRWPISSRAASRCSASTRDA